MTTTIYIILHNRQNLAVLCMNLSIPKWKKASTRWKCCVCVFDSKYSSKLKEDHVWLKITIKGTQTAASSNNEAWCFWTITELSVEPLEDRPKNWLSSSLFKKHQKIKENPRGFLHPCSTTGKSAPPVTAPDCFSKQRGLFGRHRAGPTGGRRRDLRNWRLTSVFSSVGSWLSYLGTVKGRVAGKSSEKGSTTM